MIKKIEITRSKLADFTSIKRPTLMELKAKYEHLREKMLYRTSSEEYLIHLIIGDATYCKIRTEQAYKGRPEDPIVAGTTCGWVVLVGKDYAGSTCMFTRETTDYEKLYSLDVLGVEGRGEDDQLDMCSEFRENTIKKNDRRHEVGVLWVLGAELSNKKEMASRKRLENVERKLRRNEDLKIEYEKITQRQLEQGIVEKAPEQLTGPRVFYMPHKAVVREEAQRQK